MLPLTLTLEQLEARDTPSDSGSWVFGSPLAAHPGELVRLLVHVPDSANGDGSVGSGFPIYLQGATDEVVEQTAAYYRPVLDVVRVTNRDPHAAAGQELIVHFDVPHQYFADQGFPGAIGLAYVGVKGDVWVAYRPDLLVSALVAAHETGHAFGLQHNNEYGSVMYPQASGEYAAARFFPDELITIREAVA